MSAVILLVAVGIAGAQQTLLPGALIPKFVDPLPVAGDISVVNAGPTGTPAFNIHMKEFQAQILPIAGIPANPAAGFAGLPANTPSWVWGYLTDANIAAGGVRPSYLGPVVVAERGTQTTPTYINALPYGVDSVVQQLLPIDQTLDWADPLNNSGPGNFALYSGPQPAVPHIHGGEVLPLYDGGPDAWWLPVNTITGATGSGSPAAPGAGQATFIYPNEQQAGTLWFHDHAFGTTRLNVYAGMAALYPIFDPVNEPPAGTLPAFPQYDIPLIIQDRSFDTNGQIFYNLASNPQPNPDVHPFWIPEFIGDAIVVNGKTWPFLNVEPRQYRFRFLNGSNARFYNLKLNNGAPFLVIATDQGYLNNPVSTPNLIIGPGERYEAIIDFTALPLGTRIILTNSARTPFPGGGKVVNGTTDRIMQFRVVALNPAITNTNVTVATNLRQNNPIVNIKNVVPAIKRQLTLNEVASALGPLELVLNNTKYNGVVTGFGGRETEQPQVGATELWEIINISADAHPIHMHLASFQIVSRQKFKNAAKGGYATAYAATGVVDAAGPPFPYLVRNADGAIGGNPAIGPYLQATALAPPLPYENGWKDTAIMYPGEVTRIMIRWTPTDIAVGSETPGTSQYPFDPTQLIGGVGYVWHCHILDHEDNEMMRPYVLQATPQPQI
ncbi:MAG: multicopper oxidase domain-containing protein [Deltaproteobacteria bacterium]|nr:multicopper oxidase domain-containing protein [Deltaproteobacteria bacterium]